MLELTTLEVQVSATKEKAVNQETGRKVMVDSSKFAFLNQFGATAIQRYDVERLSVETKSKIDITIHPNGSFHFEGMNATANHVALLEKWIYKISQAFRKSAHKTIDFDIEFQSHSDLKAKPQLAEASRIRTALRVNSPLIRTRGTSLPQYLIVNVKPDPTTSYRGIGYHPEFVNLYFSLKPLTPDKMKDKYLINPLEALMNVAFTELGRI